MRTTINGKLETFDYGLTFSLFNKLSNHDSIIDYQVLSNHIVIPVDLSTPVVITFKIQVGCKITRLIMISPIGKQGSSYVLNDLSFSTTSYDEDVDGTETVYILNEIIKDVLPAGVDFSITADITQEIYIDTRY